MNISSRKPSGEKFDALVIGGGHNGLVCACYLARAGWKVGVFERRDRLGGAAVTEEFWPGFRNSSASYTVSLLDPQVSRELHLAAHGLRILTRPMQNFLPLDNGDAFSAGPEITDTLSELRRFSSRDAARLPAFNEMLEHALKLLRHLLKRTPPTDLHRGRDLWEALRFGWELRALPLRVQRELHELFTRSAGEILDHWFESAPIKALYGFDSVVGNYASPYTPGSAYVLLHHAFGEVNGKPGLWGHAVGGMGAISEALASEARALGVHIECDAPVTRVLSRTDSGSMRRYASGIELGDGRQIFAPRIAGNLGPKLLFLNLLQDAELPADFRAHIERWRVGSATLRMNLALGELPQFPSRHAQTDQRHLGSGIIFAPSLKYMDRAYAEARLQGFSSEPIIEMLIPSTLDDSLAPAGQHVASLFCQHFDYQAPEGRSWLDDDLRTEAVAQIFAVIERHVPNFRRSLLGYSLLTPLDLETRFALAGGDIFHGALGLDQLWAARPALGFADYRTPVQGLYLCGAGAHPGGGVTGLPGRNAAHEMLRDGRGHER